MGKNDCFECICLELIDDHDAGNYENDVVNNADENHNENDIHQQSGGCCYCQCVHITLAMMLKKLLLKVLFPR